MTRRDRTVLAILVVVGAVAAAWFLLVAPKRNEASSLGSKISAAQSQLDAARQQVAAGQLARSTFTGSYTTMARLGEAVPSDDDVPSLIYQVQAAAQASRVDFGSLTLAGGGSSSTATSSTPGQAPPPPGATVGPAGFPIEPFTFTFSGNFFHLSDFFGRLERQVVATERRILVKGRLMALNGISFTAGPNGFPQISATVAATTFILPPTQGLQAGATSAGPSATGAPVSGGSTAPLAPATIVGGGR